MRRSCALRARCVRSAAESEGRRIFILPARIASQDAQCGDEYVGCATPRAFSRVTREERREPFIEIRQRSDGKLVFKNAVERMMTVMMEACMAEGITGQDIDMFFFHQANLRINQFIQQHLGIPDEKVVHNIQRYGNTTAATIPILLAEAEESGESSESHRATYLSTSACNSSSSADTGRPARARTAV